VKPCDHHSLDLGLAILSAITPPGVCRTQTEIAAFCNCRRGTIFMIEQRALQKLRKRLFYRNDPELQELARQVGLFR